MNIMLKPTKAQAPVNLRGALWDHTKTLHARLETLWTPKGHFASKARYLAFLETLLQVHADIGLAAAIARADAADIAVERARIDALALDLNCASPRVSKSAPVERGYAWGVGYVLNGSSLGASIILKRGYLQTDWPVAYMEIGRSYVQAGRVKSYFDTLNRQALDTAPVLAGAMDTFARFEGAALADTA